MEEKWKVSKKERGSSSNSNTKSLMWRSGSTRSSSTSNYPLLVRSFSHKASCSSSSSSSSSSNNNCNLSRTCSQKNSSICQKCTNLAKQQKARFYIIRRCVAMLVCWHKHGDS